VGKFIPIKLRKAAFFNNCVEQMLKILWKTLCNIFLALARQIPFVYHKAND